MLGERMHPKPLVFLYLVYACSARPKKTAGGLQMQ
jgi:hypothetical protein